MIIGTIAIVAVMIGIGVIVNRKFALEPEQLARTPAKPRKGLITAHEIGEAPATALRASEAQVAKLKPSLPCKTCRSILEADGTDEEVRYDGEPMRVLGFRCLQCKAKRPLYIRMPKANVRA